MAVIFKSIGIRLKMPLPDFILSVKGYIDLRTSPSFWPPIRFTVSLPYIGVQAPIIYYVAKFYTLGARHPSSLGS